MKFTTNKDISDVIDITGLVEGHSKRTTCPVCGDNTFSITLKQGNILWNCYKASCKTRGACQPELTPSRVREVFTGGANNNEKPISFKPLQNEHYWKDPFEYSHSRAMLEQFDIQSVVHQKRAGVFYDPVQCRLLFVVYHNGIPYDAVGRTLYNGGADSPALVPKWLRYKGTPYGFLVCQKRRMYSVSRHEQTKSVIVVEDAISACVMSGISDSYALLGTNLTEEHIKALREYEQAIIFLDPDARHIAQGMAKRLSTFLKVSIYNSNDDPKYKQKQEKLKTMVS